MKHWNIAGELKRSAVHRAGWTVGPPFPLYSHTSGLSPLSNSGCMMLILPGAPGLLQCCSTILLWATVLFAGGMCAGN